MSADDPLFRPFSLGSLSMRNRLVMAPMTRNRSPGGVPGQNVLEYYERRARAQVGLIITEGTTVGHASASGYRDVPEFHGREAIAGWRRIVEAVHAAGGAIAPQLWHVGSVRKGDDEAPSVGPSAVPHPGRSDDPPAHALSASEIEEIVTAFADSAGAAHNMGCDAIELHGAHGYLIDQFLWPATNLRHDEWGGDVTRRRRFAVEIVRACRAATSPDFTIIFRFSQWKLGAYRERLFHNPTELGAFVCGLRDAGVDIFHCSQRRFFEPEFDGSDLNLAGWTEQLSGCPSITVGSVGLSVDFLRTNTGRETDAADLYELRCRMEANEFQLAAVGRALLADWQWVEKVQTGRMDEITVFRPEMREALYF